MLYYVLIFFSQFFTCESGGALSLFACKYMITCRRHGSRSLFNMYENNKWRFNLVRDGFECNIILLFFWEKKREQKPKFDELATDDCQCHWLKINSSANVKIYRQRGTTGLKGLLKSHQQKLGENCAVHFWFFLRWIFVSTILRRHRAFWLNVFCALTSPCQIDDSQNVVSTPFLCICSRIRCANA